MSIGPYNCDCIIAFLFNFTWVDLWIDLLFLYKHCSWKFIDAESAFAVYSKGIWVNSLFYAFLFDDDLSFSGVVEDEDSLYLF